MPRECYIEIDGVQESQNGGILKTHKVIRFPSVELAKEYVEQVAWEDSDVCGLNVIKTKDGTCCRSFDDGLTFDFRMTLLMEFDGESVKATPNIYPEYNPFNEELLKAFGMEVAR